MPRFGSVVNTRSTMLSDDERAEFEHMAAAAWAERCWNMGGIPVGEPTLEWTTNRFDEEWEGVVVTPAGTWFVIATGQAERVGTTMTTPIARMWW